MTQCLSCKRAKEQYDKDGTFPPDLQARVVPEIKKTKEWQQWMKHA